MPRSETSTAHMYLDLNMHDVKSYPEYPCLYVTYYISKFHVMLINSQGNIAKVFELLYEVER